MNKLLNAALALVCLMPTVLAAEKPQKLKLAAVPPAVRQAIREQLPTGRPDAIERTVEDGRVIYEVNITRAGTERYFTVSEEGKLLTLQVRLDETPAAVQKTIQDHLGTDHLGQVNRTEEHSESMWKCVVMR